MGKYTRKDILDEARQLAKMLANTEEIDRFKKVEAKINESQKVQHLVTRIKALQKQAVNLQAYEKAEALNKAEIELDRAQEELDAIPIVQEFKDTQTVVNDILQLVTGTIAREVTTEVIESTGGDVLAGETGSKQKNKSTCDH